MTASTIFNSQHAALGGRLNAQAQVNTQGVTTQIGGWAALTNDVNQYLQIKFGKIYQITGVTTQGRADSAQWVTSYKLEYSLDGTSWTYYPRVRFSISFEKEALLIVKIVTEKYWKAYKLQFVLQVTIVHAFGVQHRVMMHARSFESTKEA